MPITRPRGAGNRPVAYNVAAIPIPDGSRVVADSIKFYETETGTLNIGLDFVQPDGKKGHADFPASVIEVASEPSDPREAARKESRFYVVSKRPDWCKSP